MRFATVQYTLSIRCFVIFITIVNSSRNIKSKNEPTLFENKNFDTLLFVEIYSFSDNMFLSVRFRPALDAETYTIIKWMLRKQDRSMNFYEIFLYLFIYFFLSLAILQPSENGKWKKKFRSISHSFYRENSVSSTHIKRIKAKWK